MQIHNLTQNSLEFTSNAFLVTNGRNVLIDPGNDANAIEEIKEISGDLDAVVLTHTHPDHVGIVSRAKSEFDVEAWGYDETHRAVDHGLSEGDTVEIDNAEFHVLHTPGHKDDHICLYGDGVLFSGDLIFAGGSFGRTDLAEGDRDTLISSIEKVLEFTEGEELREMHAGHEVSVTEDVRRHIEASLRNAKMM